MKVVVIGGGISGLVSAYRLKRAGVNVTLFEAGGTAGGNIGTERKDGFLFELGPNSFLSNRDLVDLILDLNLVGEVVAPKADAKTRYIVRNGRMAALPSGPASFITSNAFSTRGKAKLLAEPFIRSGSDGDESVYAFFDRRFGREIAEYALDPFISGIYAGDPRKLSVRSAFPRLYNYEKKYGSIIRGALFSPKDKVARWPKGWARSFTLRRGSATLVEALSEDLGESLVLNSNVSGISKASTGYSVQTGSGGEQFDAVVISTPAYAAAGLISGFDADLSRKLANVYYPPIAVVFTGFNSNQIAKDPAGFGVLVPAVENRRILGTLFNSSAFDNRCPVGTHLFTTFIGGSRNAETCEKSGDELIRIAVNELHSLLNINGEPIISGAKKSPRSIPQYNIGYETVTAAVERSQRDHPGLYFCSNFYNGISVGDCVKNAVSTSAKILDYVNS